MLLQSYTIVILHTYYFTILLYYYHTILWYCNMIILICYNIIYNIYAWRPWRNDPAQSSRSSMKLSVPSRGSVTQGFFFLYLYAIVVSWPSSLYHKGHNHHLTLFPCKVRQSSPTASTSRTSLSEKKSFRQPSSIKDWGIPERFYSDCLLLACSGLSPFCAEKDSEMTDMSM